VDLPVNDNVQVLFSNFEICVIRNTSGEIFIESNLDSRVKLRVTPTADRLKLTYFGGTMLPNREGFTLVGGEPK
jgi:hypothetical protein